MSKSVYEMVTERIIEQLESGVIPWEKPWTGVRDGAFNRVSKKSYSLLNNFCNQNDITIIFNLYDDDTKEIYETIWFFIGLIFFIINKRNGIENYMIMDMSFVCVRAYNKFVFST